MSDVEVAFRTMLAAAVGATANGPYPVVADQPQDGSPPYVVYHTITGTRDYVMEGAGGTVRYTFQVDVFASTLAAARTVRNAIVAGLDGVYNRIVDGVKIFGVFIDNERSDLDGNAEQSTPRLFRIVLDLSVTAEHR